MSRRAKQIVCNLLIVQTRAFAYGWLGSTQRIYDIAGGIGEHGWRTTLLTAHRQCQVLSTGEHASPAEGFPGDIVSAPFSGGPWPRWADKRGLRHLWLMGCRLCRVDSIGRWAHRFSNWLDATKLPNGPVHVIWTVNLDSAWNAQIGSRLATRLSCPFIVEFQDPVPGPHRHLSASEEQALMACLKSAALVITTTQAYAHYLEQRYPCCLGKTRTVYLSFPDESLETERATQARDKTSNDNLVLLHAGYLHNHSGRNALGLVRGLARAAEIEPASRGKIILRLMGGGPGIREASRLATELHVAESVECLPPGSMQEAVAQQMRADILVVIKFPDPAYNMQIPGKLFSCLPFGKPILGIMGQCEAADILRRTGLGCIAAHEDIEGLARYLLDNWRNRNSLSLSMQPDWTYIRQFSRSSMAAKLSEELGRVVNTFAED